MYWECATLDITTSTRRTISIKMAPTWCSLGHLIPCLPPLELPLFQLEKHCHTLLCFSVALFSWLSLYYYSSSFVSLQSPFLICFLCVYSESTFACVVSNFTAVLKNWSHVGFIPTLPISQSSTKVLPFLLWYLGINKGESVSPVDFHLQTRTNKSLIQFVLIWLKSLWTLESLNLRILSMW